MPTKLRSAKFKVESSSIHGFGVFATRTIRKGTRIVEYTGERISEKEVEARYPLADDAKHDHTFLFMVGRGKYIDATRTGSDARYINHSCQPNCEAVIEGGRIFIHALQTIAPGTELTYDYSLVKDEEPDPSWEWLYKCLCGASVCRGTMLDPDQLRPKRTKKRRR